MVQGLRAGRRFPQTPSQPVFSPVPSPIGPPLLAITEISGAEVAASFDRLSPSPTLLPPTFAASSDASILRFQLLLPPTPPSPTLAASPAPPSSDFSSSFLFPSISQDQQLMLVRLDSLVSARKHHMGL
ncbi:hypothetical protein LXL04_013583 [Taraxacum kok-saghyz]